jgi:hypothetical protein
MLFFNVAKFFFMLHAIWLDVATGWLDVATSWLDVAMGFVFFRVLHCLI